MRSLGIARIGGSAPKPPGFIAFLGQNGCFWSFWGQASVTCPLPFRPLNRSLGLLPSIALSRPVQVGSVSTKPFVGSTENQRTARTPLTSCLTFGVHRKKQIKVLTPLMEGQPRTVCDLRSRSTGLTRHLAARGLSDSCDRCARTGVPIRRCAPGWG